jgi:RNA polymerase sigma factor (TIGR02999 family)
VAAHYLAGERCGHTLQPTALVHEAYLRLARSEHPFESRQHFIHTAAKVMRQVLTDHAKARATVKRGGGRKRCDLTILAPEAAASDPIDILGLDEAMDRLERLDPRRAQVVELRFFGGLKNHEAARVLGCSVKTVENDWRAARAWLHKELAPGAA